MRNAPSFIGEFPTKHKSKQSCFPSPSDSPIEKEASLREKKKKILQRLKKDVDPGGVVSRPTPFEHGPEKVIFSPRTSKKFRQATQHLAEPTSSSQEITRLDRAKNPLIVLQKAENTEEVENEVDTKNRRHGNNNVKLSAVELRNEDDHRPPYVPSFSEKPKRRLAESISCEQKQDKASEHLNPTKKGSEASGLYENEKESSKKSIELPLIITEKETTKTDHELPFFDDDNNQLDSYTGSPFRRSASFHSLKDRHQEQSRQIRTSAEKRRQFLKVDDYSFPKASSLSSLNDNPVASSTIGGSDGKLYSSSTDFAKQQQQKLEEDFHRVEEDLDRAFSELRKYLRTS